MKRDFTKLTITTAVGGCATLQYETLVHPVAVALQIIAMTAALQ
jgi:hypothetical protein